MGNLEEAFYESLGRFVEDKTGIEVKEVTGYHDYGKTAGCETCDYGSSYDFEIAYLDNQGTRRYYSYNGPLSQLMRDLTIAD